VAPANTGAPIAPAIRYTATAAPPNTGPRIRPDKRAKRFCSTMGTGEKGRGMEIKVPAEINAAKRAVKVIRMIALLLPETETLLSLMITP
jgi:hypothetical protein